MNEEIKIQEFKKSVKLILLGLGIFLLGAGFASIIYISISINRVSLLGGILSMFTVGLLFALVCILLSIPETFTITLIDMEDDEP